MFIQVRTDENKFLQIKNDKNGCTQMRTDFYRSHTNQQP